MNTDRFERFTRKWGITIVCVMVGFNIGYNWWEGQTTSQKVSRIENRLYTNAVPDRLERIETSIGQGVKQNQEDLIRTKEAVREIEESQKKVIATMETHLGIPKDEIVAPPDGTSRETTGRGP